MTVARWRPWLSAACAGALLAACAVPAVWCPGEPLTASQMEDVRKFQDAVRKGQAYAFKERAAAEYAVMCGKLDPITKEPVLP
jgi:hypothetical protein